MRKEENRLHLHGYDLLGIDGQDGVRYAWKVCNFNEILESAAFGYKTKGEKGYISGYTTSVSLGCILRQMGYTCRFCRTGMLLPYRTHLKSEEIALQNVLMVLTDMNCRDHKELALREREFAYMGQGEPGYSYPQVRRAIQLTDVAMEKLGQKVYRHIFATSGISESLGAFADDLERKTFSSRVTLHFSLHSLMQRDIIMPIEKVYPITNLIPIMEKVFLKQGEKISIGLLLFRNFRPKGSSSVINTKIEDVQQYCHLFNPECFRFSLCEFNDTEELGTTEQYSNEEANRILEYLKSEGYAVKLFSSYGREKNTACGMLAGKKPDMQISEKWKRLENQAIELIAECNQNIR